MGMPSILGDDVAHCDAGEERRAGPGHRRDDDALGDAQVELVGDGRSEVVTVEADERPDDPAVLDEAFR